MNEGRSRAAATAEAEAATATAACESGRSISRGEEGGRDAVRGMILTIRKYMIALCIV